MTSQSKQGQILGLIGWLVVTFAASAVGAVASIQAKSFYSQLVQPAWAPPPWIFGPVWSILYALMAISAWLVCAPVDFTPIQLLPDINRVDRDSTANLLVPVY